MRFDRLMQGLWAFLAGILLTLPVADLNADFPMIVTDGDQNELRMAEKPRRVVCLTPYITEMLLALGQEKVIVGLTRQDLILNPSIRKQHVGSSFSPDIRAIGECRPDLIIAAPYQMEMIRHFKKNRCAVMVMAARKIEDAFSQIEMLGRFFDCETKAAEIIQRNRDQLAQVKARLAHIPDESRKRVTRVMAGKALTCPGDDSFQNEMIEAAGGIPPKLGKNGFAVPVSLEEWQHFNPQVIYGCNQNKKAVENLVNREGWKDVDAVRTGFITMFPCNLTCYVSTRVGYFVQWLASVLYMDTFSDPKKAVLDNTVLDRKPLLLDIAYVEQAEIVKHRVADAEFKSLVVRFKMPQDLLSTFEGSLSGVSAVGNTFIPMPASLGHMACGVAKVQQAIRNNLGFSEGEFATLMTGANMDNLAIKKVSFEDLEVAALVTAGVKGNAMRMSRDAGAYYKPGTINIIVLTNRRLTPNAMARAIITVTEAKSAALLDLDIRSSYTPWDFRATGTGTDNVLMVQGEGPAACSTSGHHKLGELIAKAVHAGVTEAIFKQNGLKADRNLFQRLADRKMSLEQIVKEYPVETSRTMLLSRLEKLLMTPYYATFLESALSISDDYQKGLVKELAFFDTMCSAVAARIAGRPEITLTDVQSGSDLPIVMAKAFGALITGITEKEGV